MYLLMTGHYEKLFLLKYLYLGFYYRKMLYQEICGFVNGSIIDFSEIL